ncbi:MAG: hypothetical protein NE328_05805 [Lentisphaeraceae bacterium]|nr:hypothetical protein [Lentisphaeraceae bacterium]
MAKARKAQIEISLFPFLSILACVIGILVLILCTVVISQIDPEGVEEVKKQNEENLKKKQRLDELEIARLELEKKLKEAESKLNKKVDFSADLKKAQLTLAQLKKEIDSKKDKSIEVNKLSEELVIKLKQKDTLLASLAEKEKLHKALMEAIEKEKERIHSKLKLESTGSGFLANFSPIYIDCTQTGITVMTDDQPLEIARGAIAKNKEWLEMQKKAAASDKSIFVFLVRPTYEAVSNYWYAKSVCEKNGAQTSKIPLNSKLPLALGSK